MLIHGHGSELVAVAQELVKYWDSLGGLSRLYVKISKIRARQCTRNEQDSNFHLGRPDVHAARGREVFPHFPVDVLHQQ